MCIYIYIYTYVYAYINNGAASAQLRRRLTQQTPWAAIVCTRAGLHTCLVLKLQCKQTSPVPHITATL